MTVEFDGAIPSRNGMERAKFFIRRLTARLVPENVRTQILAFALLSALVPSLVIAVIAYAQNRVALTEKISHELATTSAQAGRDVEVWVREHLYDLRVFASSYVVAEAFSRRGGSRRLVDYLKSVQARFGDYDELQLLDARGRLVGSSAARARPVPLPAGWAKSIEREHSYVGEPYWDESGRTLYIILGMPVERVSGRLRGVLLARANFTQIVRLLRNYESHGAGRVYLTTDQGRPIADTRDVAAGTPVRELGPEACKRLAAAGGNVIEFRGWRGVPMLGSAWKLPRIAWMAVTEMSVAEAYRQVARLRNVSMLIVVVTLLVVAFGGHLFASLIAGPLDRLSGALAKVSAGDLSVDLPRGGSGEVLYLTQMFNTMVESLRKHRGEMERLSITDALTGLTNRRHLMTLLEAEVKRSKRSAQPFSVLMLDVDHFKRHNDEYGHLAGDEVLVRLGSILRESLRTYDCAARYGGEEFLVMLSGTGKERAMEVAERLRARMRSERFSGATVTLSIGVADFPRHGEDAEAVIGAADDALYEAKRAGRDRVVYARERGVKAGPGG